MIWSGIIVGAFVYFFSEPLVKLCFGNPFLAAIPALQIMAWKGLQGELMPLSRAGCY